MHKASSTLEVIVVVSEPHRAENLPSPENQKTLCGCRENKQLVKRYATGYLARLHSQHWFNGNTMKAPAFGFFVIDNYES
jgi:hypothetical protein